MGTRLAVITCVWQRPERLRYTLDGLAAQEYADFDVLLINNNAALRETVDGEVGGTDRVRVWHNEENRGPFARIEVMYECRAEYDWFLWLDDDVVFDASLVGEWMKQAEPGTLKSWNGFRFVGNYWQRENAKPGENCHYLWGSNLLAPAAAVQSVGVLDMPRDYWLCADDLWLCYYASHVLGLRLTPGRVDVRIDIDGRDTYLHVYNHAKKVVFLDELRARGWAV